MTAADLKGFMKEMKTVGDKERILSKHLRPILGDCLTNFMLEKGFCSAPASTIYHGNHEGGLFEHCIIVAHCLQNYTEQLGLEWERDDSPIRIGFMHDLCKIDLYRKVEDLDSDRFYYEHDNTPIVKGHGNKSVIYALMNGAILTEEEVACILYHMGSFTEKERWGDYDNAIKKYSNVLFTHTADMEASQIYGC